MRYLLCLLLALVLSPAQAQVSVQTWTPPIQLPAYAQGMRADRLGIAINGYSADTIILEGGSFASANGIQVFSYTQNIYTDPQWYGACGRDQVPLWNSGQAVYMFLITYGSKVCGLLSASTDYGGVSVPFGWTMQRKHPFAMNWWTWYSSTPSFANFHYSGAQNPWIEFRDLSESSAPNQFIRYENTLASVVCRRDWMPSIVPTGSTRMIRVQTGLYIPAGYSAVSGYVGPFANALNYVGTFTGIPSSEIRSNGLDMVVQSDGTYCFRSYGILNASVKGYQITEVTD